MGPNVSKGLVPKGLVRHGLTSIPLDQLCQCLKVAIGEQADGAEMSGSFESAIAAIDAANVADPNLEPDGERRVPAALLYGHRMSEECARLFPEASEVLRIAARGQHIERWTLPRSDFPEGREGYLAWRREQARRHAERVAGIMADSGYGPEECARVGTILRKERIKRDAEVQQLEDVICFVFLRWYMGPFAEGRDLDDLRRIVSKTARKMSDAARQKAIAEFEIPAPFVDAFAS